MTTLKIASPLPPELDKIGTAVLNCAYKVHKNLGSGLLEKVYEICLAHELQKLGHKVQRQVTVPLSYDGIHFPEALRVDLLVEGKIIVEVKAVEAVNPVWKSQIISYLKITNLQLGYIINFDVELLKHGISRIVNTNKSLEHK